MCIFIQGSQGTLCKVSCQGQAAGSDGHAHDAHAALVAGCWPLAGSVLLLQRGQLLLQICQLVLQRQLPTMRLHLHAHQGLLSTL